MAKPTWEGYLNQLEKILDLYLVQKAPALPTGVREFIVKIAPWLTLIGVILSVPGILIALGLKNIVPPFTDSRFTPYYGPNYTLSLLILAVAIVLEALAIRGLFSRQARAWRLLYWATLVAFLSNLVNLNVLGGVLGTLFSLYFLFQIKSYYK